MNKWHGAPILLLLLTGNLGSFRYSEACETISSVQCVNSTHFLWCIDIGDGSLVTIGNAEACPGILVCDDTQVEGCVAANTVTTTELPLDTTTAALTSTTILITDTTETEESSTTESISTDLTTGGSTDTTTINTPDLTTTGESSTSESTSDLTTSTPTDDTTIIYPSDSPTTENPSIVSDADFSCTYEGLYRAEDCTRFHVCYKFIWFIKHYFARCSEGLYWSSVEKRCVLKSFSDCQ